MKLFEGRTGVVNLVRSYGPEGITVGAASHALPLLLSATESEPLEGRSLATLTAEDVERIVSRTPDLVLAGSAAGNPQVPAALRHALESRRIAVESMQLGAACRTFNVLVQEERAVLALLFD